MPFTLAHPAIVVPLARRRRGRLVLPALVVGSMAPDFEYFAYLRPLRTIGHDLIGIPLLCVPAGLVALWLFEVVLKGPMVRLLPRDLRERLAPISGPIPFRPHCRLAMIVVSLAIGAFSHVAWDAFTHENGWAVERIPVLSATVGPGWKACKILQHASTFAGLALVSYWSWRWLRDREPSPEPAGRALPERARLATIALLVAVSLAGGSILCAATFDEAMVHGPRGPIARFVIGAITSFSLAALAYGAFERMKDEG
jgi:hypothetical protein